MWRTVLMRNYAPNKWEHPLLWRTTGTCDIFCNQWPSVMFRVVIFIWETIYPCQTPFRTHISTNLPDFFYNQISKHILATQNWETFFCLSHRHLIYYITVWRRANHLLLKKFIQTTKMSSENNINSKTNPLNKSIYMRMNLVFLFK